MPNVFWEQFPKVFELAVKTPLGVFALLSCILALIAWLFFRGAGTGPKVFAFVVLFLGVCLLGYATFDSAAELQLAEDARRREARKCLDDLVAKFQDRKPVSTRNEVRCEGGGTRGSGDTQEAVVALDAPPGYAFVGPPEIKDVRRSRGSHGALQFVSKDSLTTGIRLPIRCESPSQVFGPGAWMGATLAATVERPISEGQHAAFSKQCGLIR
jgi:hypothetical protein